MSYFRQIHTSIWKDEEFLHYTLTEKLLFVYFFSNESTTLSGVYKLPLKVASFETGIRLAAIEKALVKFEKAAKIYYRDGYIFVVNFQKYNSGSAKLSVSIKKEIDNLEDCEIKAIYMRYYHPDIPYAYPMDTVSIPYPEKNKSNIGYAYPIDSKVKNSKEKKSKEKVKAEIDLSSDKSSDGTEHQKMIRALEAVTRLDMKIRTNAGRIVKASKELRDAGYTPEQVIQFGQYWKNDWRYKRDKTFPSPQNVVAEISRMTYDEIKALPAMTDDEFIQAYNDLYGKEG